MTAMKFRRVYSYVCRGCDRKRIAYRYERAKNEKCTQCCPRVDKVADGQVSLFDALPT